VTDSVRPVQRSIDSTVPPVDLQAWFALPDTTGTLLVCMGRDFLGPGPFFLVTLEGNTAPLVEIVPWAGAEGDYDALQQQSADTFTTLVDGSRYWSPQ
jgi:hypothetical protein